MKKLDKQTERVIKKLFKKVYNEIYSKKNIYKFLNKRFNGEEILKTYSESLKFKRFCKKLSKELTSKGLNKERGLWRKFFEIAKKKNIGVIPSTFKEYQDICRKKVFEKNLSMIKSIPKQVLEVNKFKYIEALKDQIIYGSEPRSSLYKMLKQIGSKRASLIARTETAKLQTALIEEKCINLNSKCYQWLSSNDTRTRKSHKEMNKCIVFWSNDDNKKPHIDNMIGNAGEFPNCRCSPEPIFDISDIEKSNGHYKIYDVYTHKIKYISKKELVSILQSI